MLRTLLVSLVALLAVPATALAADGDVHKDRTTEIMLGIIFVLLLAMLLIGILESRSNH